MNPATKQSETQPRAFANGKVDPREAGRRGGVQSGISRRLRPQRLLEERIAASSNGAALFALLKVRQDREQELERRRLEADRQLIELESWSGRAQLDLEQAIERREQVEAELASVEARLEAARSDQEILKEVLLAAGEERVSDAVESLGWYDDDEAEP
jgi:hypothetical protein